MTQNFLDIKVEMVRHIETTCGLRILALLDQLVPIPVACPSRSAKTKQSFPS